MALSLVGSGKGGAEVPEVVSQPRPACLLPDIGIFTAFHAVIMPSILRRIKKITAFYAVINPAPVLPGWLSC